MQTAQTQAWMALPMATILPRDIYPMRCGGLRRLHWDGMLCSAVELVAIVGSIPYIVVAPA